MTRNGLLKEAEERNVEMCSLEMKSPSVCCSESSRDRKRVSSRDRERMFPLVSAGLNLLPARRKGKERSSMVSAAFYGARGGVPWQNSIGHSH